MKTPQALVGRRLQTLVFVLVGGLMLPSSLSSQTLLNVNFAAYNNVKIGFAATGLTADDFWNNYTAPFQSFAWLSDLTMANGTRSSVGLTVQNGAGHWTFTFPDLMYDCYCYSQDRGDIILTVTNLPGGHYDFYLYGHETGPTGNTVFQLLAGGADYGNRSTATNSDWALTNWVEGAQYVVFRSVVVSSGGVPVTIKAHPGLAGDALLNGMQIRTSPAVAPAIIAQPTNQVVQAGSNAYFGVTASGTLPLSYQWRYQGEDLPGRTDASLTITNVQLANGGSYSVLVSNLAGTVVSSNALLTVIPASTSSCDPAPAGLVSWWRCEGNAFDSSGSNDGTLAGGVGFTSGEVGQAFSFNGTNSYVQVPSRTNLNPTGSFSIEAWIYPRQNGTGAIASKWGDTGELANQRSYSFATTPGGGLQFGIADWAHQWDSSFHLFNTPSGAITLQAWNHVAAVYDQSTGTRRIFVNGVQVASRTDAPITVTNGLAPFTIGADVHGGGVVDAYFGGLIDELSFYSRALSATEVAAIYSAGSAGKCVASCVQAPAGLVSWWQADASVDDTVGGNNGLLVNGAGFANGEVGQAFNFDGVNDYVKIPKSASLDAPTQLTIDFWMSADPSQPIGSRVVGLVTSDFYGFEIGTSASKVGVVFFVSTDNGGHFVSTFDLNSRGAVFPAGEWHHIAGVYDGAKVQLYLDGQALGNPAPVTGQISPMLANSFVAIGSSDGRTTCGECFGSRYFKGMIDEVDFFNRALSPSEIAAIWGAGAAGKCLSGLAPSITAQPVSQTVLAGSTAAFTVTATGTPPLGYQWRFGGTNIAGATGTSFTLSNVQPAQAGTYSVQVTNAYGSTNSANALLTVTSSPPACVQAPAGLVSWWQADASVDDTVGGNDGILVNGASFAAGKVGQAFSFNGSNQYVKIPRAASLDFSNQLTIDLWMKADPSAPIGSRLEGLVTGDFFGLEVGDSPAGVYCFVSTDNGAHFPTTADASGHGAIFTTGEWHHVAGTYDGSKLQFYLDGQPYGSPTPASGAISPMLGSSFVTLGSEDGRTMFPFCIGTRYFAGEIDEVDIFNRALSASEIAAIYNAGAQGKCGQAAAVVLSPTNRVATVGADVSFTVAAKGTPPLAYQWQFNRTNISGGTTTALSVTNVQLTDSGSYSVIITNAYGVATSSIALLTVNPAPPCAAPPADLVSWWRGEGDAADEWGTNNGTLQNGAAFGKGEVGQAFSFDGINDYVKIPRAPNLDVGSQVTIDLWMKADPSAPIGSRLEGLIASDYYGLEVGNAPAGVFLFLSTDNGAHFVTSADANGQGAIFPVGEWHHVAGTYDGAKLQFYLDGQPYGKPTPASGTISPMLTNSFVTLGSEDGRKRFPFVIGTRYFAGEIDEADIFNRALSASEIAAIYQAGSTGKCRSPHTATATATLANGFVVGVNLTNPGWGYTTVPVVKFIGGGGSGAQAVAVVSNGQIVGITVLNAGFGYTNTPVVVIGPPFVSQPIMAIGEESLLSFSNLAVGTNYQLQFFKGNTWSNLGAAFTASSSTFTQYVSGTADANSYRLASTPVPTQAYATAQTLNGFVVGAAISSGGSGYTTNPAVSIVGGGGSNATALATVSNGAVIKVTITNAGIGYTNTPSILIAPPPANALWPVTTRALALRLSGLSPYDNYQVEATPALGTAWSNVGTAFTPTSTTSTQYVSASGDVGFFRVRHVP